MMPVGYDDSDNDCGTGIANTLAPFPGALILIRIGSGLVR